LGYDEVEDVVQNWEELFDQHLLRTGTLKIDEVPPLQYWKDQPPSLLRIVAIQVLSVTASSAPVERMFSSAGNICTDSRTSMLPDLLSALMRAKYNNQDEEEGVQDVAL
jgi:hypothetical protein